MNVWRHSRKGIIRGSVVAISGDGMWMHIKLEGDHRLSYGSEANRGRVDVDGSVITVRAAFLEVMEVPY